MATTPDLQEPQIAAARAKAWQQSGDALLTMEAAREWLNHYGIVLFAPRGGSLGAPAPSLVEATLGEAKGSVSLADTETARSLTARLVAEGSALPLNLLAGPGDLPDFVVSTQVFPFVFTLRGDKGWKRAPETSGAVRVTPLGLRVYELLTEKGALTISEIVPEIGREVTESAVARALSELWQILRVLPVLQQGEGETRWELTTTRFLKAVKAGANAGQPTALSALVSLYLSQAYVASEDEIAGFLSPLTARSRVREVLHGLVAGRQLAEGVVNGKAVLFVPESLPDFAAFTPAEPETETGDETGEGSETSAAEGEAAPDGQAPRERIRRFGEGAAGRSGDRDLRGKPFRPRERREDGGRRESFGARRPGQGRDAEGGGDRRPFAPRGERPARRAPGTGGFGGERRERPQRSGDDRPARPSYTRPWDEERPAPRRREGGEEAGGRERPFRPRPAQGGDAGEGRPFRERPARGGASREGAGERPFRERAPRREGDTGAEKRGERPFRPRREDGDTRPPRREGGFRPAFRRDEGGETGEARPRGRSFPPREGKPFRGTRDDRGGDRPFRPRPAGDRPPRERSEGDRPFRPRPAGDRPPRERSEGDRPFRPRPAGDRPPRERREGDRPFRPRPAGDRPPRGEGDRPFRPRPAGDRPPRAGAEGGRPFRPRREGAEGAGRGSRPERPGGGARFGGDRPRGPRTGPGGGAGRGPGRGFGGPRPAGKRAGSKFPGRTDRPARPPRRERPEDEA